MGIHCIYMIYAIYVAFNTIYCRNNGANISNSHHTMPIANMFNMS